MKNKTKLKYTTNEILYKKNINLREKKMIIYLAEDKNKKSYIGKTEQKFKNRIKEHIRHDRTLFEKEINTQGIENFKWMILDYGKTKKDLYEKEIKYIAEFNTKVPYGYNMTAGGSGTKDYIYSDEGKELQSKIKTKFYKDPKNRAKVKKGVLVANAVNPSLGVAHSMKMKTLFDKTTIAGKKRRENAAQKQSDYINRDENNLVEHIIARGGRPFFVLKNSKVVGAFLGLSTCARKLGLNSSHIHSILNGKRKTTKGYTFRYMLSGRMLKEVEKEFPLNK